ncbi:recombinase family protein [Brevibacterium linens]|uniref:recombinase family protein n=1 Tax=Brevibacterium linens TaxID=1703 RepID=UPI003F8CB284
MLRVQLGVRLAEMITYVREGDIVRVKSPDRLVRSTRDLLALVEQLQAKGVRRRGVRLALRR